ncbi:hypothetical protein GCM10010387_15600 [Streptomyces inusitatus]|uniref:Uncharacterized protein n=1 Tax=Streptomyces inusitatus TaxID=68221 RepID=A0A918UMY7_9ACTN|nr:hypothetical protein GCM10010387_15600 [Streptomyces inusitatus]
MVDRPGPACPRGQRYPDERWCVMPCSCGKKRNRFEVVAEGTGKVLFTSSSEGTANAVSKRYPGSTVRESGTKEINHSKS